MKPETQTRNETDALAELRANMKNNSNRWRRFDAPTTIQFNGGKVFLSQCKNYIRVKTSTGSSSYMLRRKTNRRNIAEAEGDERISIVEDLAGLAQNTVAMLKDICDTLGVSKTGRKADIIARLEALKGEEE